VADHDVTPDPPLTPEQEEIVALLSDADLARIDQALLSKAGPRRRKVAFIAGSTMSEFPESIPGIPDVFYAQRIRRLVDTGELEAFGYLDSMRYCEVRLSNLKPGGNET